MKGKYCFYIGVFLLFDFLHAYQSEQFFDSKHLTLKDSIVLQVPEEYTPKYVYDIVINNEKIYLCNESNYPVLVFSVNGTFIKNIGERGDGPNQFPFNPRKLTVNEKGNKIALTDGPLGITIYEIVEDVFKRSIDPELAGIVDVEFINDKLVVVGSSIAKNHLLVLDDDLQIEARYINVPKASTILDIVKTPFWGIQVSGNVFFTHLAYPIIVYKNMIVGGKIKFDKVKASFNQLENYYKLDAEKGLEEVLSESTNPIHVRLDASHINWLTYNKGIFIGQYLSNSRKTGKPFFTTFVLSQDAVIAEYKLTNIESSQIIPQGNLIIKYDFVDFSKSADIVLKVWEINGH